MMTIYLAPLVAMIGAAIYGFASNSKASEIGRLMFACGLLVALFVLGRGHEFHLP